MHSSSMFSRRRVMGVSAAGLGLTLGGLSLRPAIGETGLSSRLQNIMDGHVADHSMPGAVWSVYRNGETITGHSGKFAYAFGRSMAPNTVFRIASVTKPVTATLAMRLVDEGKLSLDAPVDSLLPELANRRVLADVAGPLTDTVVANTPITLRHLLTLTFGLGLIATFPEQYPIQVAMRGAGIAPSWELPAMSSDDYLARLASLPLAYQPGERFLYNNGLDVAGILIERATGRVLADVMEEKIFAPLGMIETGFEVPAERLDRLPTLYARNPQTCENIVMDEPSQSRWAETPLFASGASGLVSTVGDYMRFARMLLQGGELEGTRIISTSSVAEMARGQLTASQQAHPDAVWFMAGGAANWGLGVSVTVRADKPWFTIGRFGWDGGYGTSAYIDPANGVVGILFSQQMMDTPEPPQTFVDFWSALYA